MSPPAFRCPKCDGTNENFHCNRIVNPESHGTITIKGSSIRLTDIRILPGGGK